MSGGIDSAWNRYFQNFWFSGHHYELVAKWKLAEMSAFMDVKLTNQGLLSIYLESEILGHKMVWELRVKGTWKLIHVTVRVQWAKYGLGFGGEGNLFVVVAFHSNNRVAGETSCPLSEHCQSFVIVQIYSKLLNWVRLRWSGHYQRDARHKMKGVYRLGKSRLKSINYIFVLKIP